MGMLQGAPHPPTNGLQRFVTAGNLACCLGDQRLCAHGWRAESRSSALTTDETPCWDTDALCLLACGGNVDLLIAVFVLHKRRWIVRQSYKYRYSYNAVRIWSITHFAFILFSVDKYVIQTWRLAETTRDCCDRRKLAIISWAPYSHIQQL